MFNRPLRRRGLKSLQNRMDMCRIVCFSGLTRVCPKIYATQEFARFIALRGLHVPSRKLIPDGIQRYGLATINACQSAIAQAGPSGGSSRENLQKLCLRITGSTATTEPQ